MKFVAWMAYHLESREIADNYIAKVRRYLEGHEFVVCEDLESIKREIRDADAMVGWRITPEVFAEARRLRWIQFGSAGIDHTIFPELVASDVILTNLSGIHTSVVAEHVIGLMLGLVRRLDLSMKLQMERRFDRAEIAATATELWGKTLGIVGLGKIGLNLARLAKAFEMRVAGTKRTSVPGLPNVDRLYPAEAMREMLPECDFVTLLVPLTSGTKAMLGAEEIGAMRGGSYLVNVARGAMVDHEALSEALESGKLAGAALDVFPQEPLPPDSPIWTMPNVIITPHTAGSTPIYSERAAAVFKRNLDAFVSGGEMVNVYQRERGY